MNKSIFSKAFLEQYIKDFRLSSQVEISRTKDIIENWNSKLESKRLLLSKEEETKSIFIMEIFGDVLGFNYKNPSTWLIREELKTNEDATKSDAALGRFKINETGIENDVDVIIEIKDAKTALDKPQNRVAFKISPIDQAFLYASKVGGNCKWVVVSNFTEIRFYHYSNQGEYQSYLLIDLRDEAVLKEFLFLFHKDRLTNNEKSATDKLYELRKKAIGKNQSDKHIIDQLYDAIHKFEGLEFIDPNFLCNIFPFNLTDEYVWHYNRGRLLVLNPQVTELLKEITTSDEGLLLSEQLTINIRKHKVVEAQQKLEYVFEKLHQFKIEKICAPLDLKSLRKKEFRSLGYSLRHFNHIADNELVIVSTGFSEAQKCDCVTCSFRNFDFNKYIDKLKHGEQNQSTDTFELAYGNYLISTDNFKKSYFLYKNADINTKGKEDKKIHYFLSKINQMYLYNLVANGSKKQQEKEILQDIKTIDLDRSIHDELEIYVDSDVRKYLIEIKENKLFIKTKDFITNELEKLEKSNGIAGDIEEILQRYLILHAHIHKNKIIYDAFSDFQTVSQKVFRALIIAHMATKQSIEEIPEFYFTEATQYISTQNLKLILNPYEALVVSYDTQISLVEKTKNLLLSYAKEGILGHSIKESLIPSQLENFWFRRRFLRIFSNLFTLLSKFEMPRELAETLAKPISTFLKTEDFLGWDNLRTLGVFVEKHGYIFKQHQLQNLLEHTINNTRYGYHKYEELLKPLCIAYKENNPNQPISNKSLIHKAIANSMNPQGEPDPRRYLYLYPIIEEQSKQKMLVEINAYLNTDFDHFIFFDMLALEIVPLNEMYLSLYIDSTAKSKGKGFIGVIDGNADYEDVTMINFINKIYGYNIQLDKVQLDTFKNLSPFESWALNPHEFNYQAFDTDWLIPMNTDYILDKLAQIPAVKESLERRLSACFNITLAEIYFKFFREKEYLPTKLTTNSTIRDSP